MDKALASVAVTMVLALASAAWAGTTWDGEGVADANWTTAANWDDDTLPAFDGSDDIIFGTMDASGTVTVLDGDKWIGSLTLDPSLEMSITGGTLTLESGNISRTGNPVIVTIDSNIELGASGIWNFASTNSTNTIVNGIVSDGGNGYGISVTGSRYAYFYGNNTFGGGLRLTRYTVRVDVYSRTRSQLGEDIAAAEVDCYSVIAILEAQDTSPAFGLSGVHTFHWSGKLGVFPYASSSYWGSQFTLEFMCH